MPWVPPDAGASDAGGGLPTGEYIDLYGYGISTDPDTYRQTILAQQDPNMVIAQALSHEALAEYERALTGIDPAAIGDEPTVIEDGGCMKEASDALIPNDAIPTELIDEYYTLKNQLETQIVEDPRMRQALANWRECMADHNYSFQDPGETRDSVYAKWAELVPDPAPEIATPQDASNLERTELAKFVDPDLLDQLIAYELDLARIDYECQTEYRQVETDVRLELETRFIENNADLIQRISHAIR